MAYTARQLFADWYTKVEKKADVSILQKRLEAIDTIISTELDQDFWLDVLKLALGIKVSTSQKIVEYFKTTDIAFPIRNNENITKVLANAILCFRLEEKGNQLNDKLSLAILNSQTFGAYKFVKDIPVVENAESHIQIRIIDDRKIENTIDDLDDLDAASSNAGFAMDESQVISLTTAIRQLDTQNKLLMEETNILWWLISETSKESRKMFAEIGLPKLAILAPLDLYNQSQFSLGIPTPYDILSKVLFIGNERKTKMKDYTIFESVEQLNSQEKHALLNAAQNNIDEFTPCLNAVKLSLDSEGDSWVEKFQRLNNISADTGFNVKTLSTEIYNELLYANL